MACGATLSLKRSLEFDPLYTPGQLSPKRRRCTPMNVSVSPPQASKSTKFSTFQNVVPKLSKEEIAVRIHTELKRMHRRRQIAASASTSNASTSDAGEVNASISEVSAPRSPQSSASVQSFFSGSPSASGAKKDPPLFTFRHLNVICEKLLKEREDQIRKEYDQVLTCKLAEQYQAFLKFNHDQLHRRFRESAASYVS